MKRITLVLTAVLLAAYLCGCVPRGVTTIENETDGIADEALSRPQEQDDGPLTGVSFLTGLPVDPDLRCNTRFAAVVIDNLRISAYMQMRSGLSEASVVYEVLMTDGGLTRFLALYENYKTMPVAGPVRELYDQLFQLALPLNALVISNRMNLYTADYVDQYGYQPWMMTPSYDDAVEGSVDYGLDVLWVNKKWTETATFEFTRYTDGGNLSEVLQYAEIDAEYSYTEAVFRFLPPDELPRPLNDGAANSISVIHSDICSTQFSFNAVNGRYYMNQAWGYEYEYAYEAIDDNTGLSVGFDNVFVLFADAQPYPAQDPQRFFEGNSVIEVRFSKGGSGYYFNGGKYEKIWWLKQSPDDKIQIVSPMDKTSPVTINIGTSYVAIVNAEMQAALSFTQ